MDVDKQGQKRRKVAIQFTARLMTRTPYIDAQVRWFDEQGDVADTYWQGPGFYLSGVPDEDWVCIGVSTQQARTFCRRLVRLHLRASRDRLRQNAPRLSPEQWASLIGNILVTGMAAAEGGVDLVQKIKGGRP